MKEKQKHYPKVNVFFSLTILRLFCIEIAILVDHGGGM